jgi:hypothetical protein
MIVSICPMHARTGALPLRPRDLTQLRQNGYSKGRLAPPLPFRPLSRRSGRIPALPYPPLRCFQSGSTATPPSTENQQTAITPLTSCLTPGVHFNFTDIALSKSAPGIPILFTLFVANETGTDWKDVFFEVHVRRSAGGGETTFKAYPKSDSDLFPKGEKREVRIHIPGSEGEDASAFGEYLILVRGKMWMPRAARLYSGFVVEGDCLGDLTPAMQLSGVERRKKLLELITLKCLATTPDKYEVVFMSSGLGRLVGPANDRREYVEAVLHNIHSNPPLMNGWIEKGRIEEGAISEYADYPQILKPPAPAPNFKAQTPDFKGRISNQ